MITYEKFSGGAMYLDKTTLFGVPYRALDVSGVASVTLGSRTKLQPGGPYFYLNNVAGGSIPIKNELGTTLVTLTAGTMATIYLGTSKWIARKVTVNVGHTFGSTTSERTDPVGTIVAPVTLTPPTTYDPIDCAGGWRRARVCETGAKANIWMTAGDVTTIDGIRAFTYAGQCFYFTDEDSLLTGHGPLLTAGDVTWFDTCEGCLSNFICNPNNPNLPPNVVINIASGFPGFNGDHVVNYDGGQYRADPATLEQPYYYITLYCDAAGWIIEFGYDLTHLPGGATVYTWSRFQIPTPYYRPLLGQYPFKEGSTGGSPCSGVGCWNDAFVVVQGYLT